ncbi:MAG: polyphosphate kinase 1 [Helicobacter sp.]|nr:polyphosphate kinase 1 [Helicobacter sp.]
MSACFCNLINRQISWLKFNSRVLNQSIRSDFGLKRRLGFLGIYGTNLDEFYMIRVSNLKMLFESGVNQTSQDCLGIQKELDLIDSYIRKESKEFSSIFSSIISELRAANIHIVDYNRLSEFSSKFSLEEIKILVKEHFFEHIFPALSVIVCDNLKLTNENEIKGEISLPICENLSTTLALILSDKQNNAKLIFIKIPKGLARFFKPDLETQAQIFIPIVSIISALCDELFADFSANGFNINQKLFFRVTRHADIEIEQLEADDLIMLTKRGLKARENGKIRRLEARGNIKAINILNFLQEHLGLKNSDIYANLEAGNTLDANTFFDLEDKKYFMPLLNPSSLHEICANATFADEDILELPKKLEVQDIFAKLQERDLLLYQPYDDFALVEDFIERACLDDDVLSIKMTLYRAGSRSRIINSLILAAKTKQVSVIIELKARFDEENNLHWAKALENAGAHVIYSLPNIKVHAKATLIVRKEGEGDKTKLYAHLSSGNYNSKSAKIYTDVSFLTSDPRITKDLTHFFHALTIGHAPELLFLSAAPNQIKDKLLHLIANEAEFGEQGHIILKANALVSLDIINALKLAASAGARIDLIIRGICVMLPSANENENINVISIVGRFLEHARIYYFKHDDAIYFSSADLMPRNLSRRIELMVPITDCELKRELESTLFLQLQDGLNAYVLSPDGEYHKRAGGLDSQIPKKD